MRDEIAQVRCEFVGEDLRYRARTPCAQNHSLNPAMARVRCLLYEPGKLAITMPLSR